MSDEPKKRSRAWIVWALIAALIVYPLSIGPATECYDACADTIGMPPMADKAFAVFYWPIHEVCGRVPRLDKELERYMIFWYRLLPMGGPPTADAPPPEPP
jgi:hypothetical protein